MASVDIVVLISVMLFRSSDCASRRIPVLCNDLSSSMRARQERSDTYKHAMIRQASWKTCSESIHTARDKMSRKEMDKDRIALCVRMCMCVCVYVCMRVLIDTTDAEVERGKHTRTSSNGP